MDGDSFPVDGSSDVVLFSYDAGFAKFSFSHDLEVEDDLSATDLYISSSFGLVELAVGLQSATNVAAEITDGTAIVADVDTFGISASITLVLQLSASHSALPTMMQLTMMLKYSTLALEYQFSRQPQLTSVTTP